MALTAVSARCGPPHACPYLPGRVARLAWVDPAWAAVPGVYGALVAQGFRRSGGDVYRPHCEACAACIPVRLPVAEFAPDRSQRRTWRRNADLTVAETEAEFRDEHYRLYLRYQRSRHADGGMVGMSPDEYLGFLSCDWQDTVFVEFRRQGRLLAVSVADRVHAGLSAVYTFFDPDEHQRGLGTHAVLYLVERCRALDLAWCYLGYWIEGSRKMDYKRRFRPLEGRVGGSWVPLAEATVRASAEASRS
ncbi:arginyltransferase [Methylolobus aquaticus]|nr:arginyltransferase [Methylolobus aquaticus]